MKEIVHDTSGVVCASQIVVRINEDSNTVDEVVFYGGCPGNHLGIAALVKGMPVPEAVRRLAGIRCGNRNTSCPDQLAEALRKVL